MVGRHNRSMRRGHHHHQTHRRHHEHIPPPPLPPRPRRRSAPGSPAGDGNTAKHQGPPLWHLTRRERAQRPSENAAAPASTMQQRQIQHRRRGGTPRRPRTRPAPPCPVLRAPHSGTESAIASKKSSDSTPRHIDSHRHTLARVPHCGRTCMNPYIVSHRASFWPPTHTHIEPQMIELLNTFGFGGENFASSDVRSRAWPLPFCAPAHVRRPPRAPRLRHDHPCSKVHGVPARIHQ